jgi:hypothetical protein
MVEWQYTDNEHAGRPQVHGRAWDSESVWRILPVVRPNDLRVGQRVGSSPVVEKLP